MKGNNSMELCKSAMAEIVQEWIDRSMPHDKLKVTDVSANKSMNETFIVSFCEAEGDNQ